jgi:hypothetical protein
LTLSNTSSFPTRFVQLISILLKHHIPKLFRYFRTPFRSAWVSAKHTQKLWSKCITFLEL